MLFWESPPTKLVISFSQSFPYHLSGFEGLGQNTAAQGNGAAESR